MGTRSRLLIRRSCAAKKTIYLWMKWDGYFSGVGAGLCSALKKLLETYTIPEIRRMIDALDIADDKDGQRFNPKDLIPFLEGKTEYKNDPCDDIEYEYVLDADLATFVGKHYDEWYMLHFDQILAGKDFDSIIPAEPESEPEETSDDKTSR